MRAWPSFFFFCLVVLLAAGRAAAFSGQILEMWQDDTQRILDAPEYTDVRVDDAPGDHAPPTQTGVTKEVFEERPAPRLDPVRVAGLAGAFGALLLALWLVWRAICGCTARAPLPPASRRTVVFDSGGDAFNFSSARKRQ